MNETESNNKRLWIALGGLVAAILVFGATYNSQGRVERAATSETTQPERFRPRDVLVSECGYSAETARGARLGRTREVPPFRGSSGEIWYEAYTEWEFLLPEGGHAYVFDDGSATCWEQIQESRREQGWSQ
jgi:hypothetical protein